MTRIERRDAYAEQMPPPLRAVFEQQLAAGNELLDFEIGRGEREGQVLLAMDHPFRATIAALPDEVVYRESLDREPMLFEFLTRDGKWSLATAKLKPMKFSRPEPLPPDPQMEYVARTIARQEAEAKRPPPSPSSPAPTPVAPVPKPTDPAERFIASMVMDFDKWHDGTGYDLDALAKVPPEQRQAIEAMLLARDAADWRDVEALAQIDTPRARAAVVAALASGDPDVRRIAMQYVPAASIDASDRAAQLIRDLRGGAVSGAVDEAVEFHPPGVIDALIRGALDRPGPPAVHFAALLYFLHGKSEEPFDWSHRPFFLRFNGDDKADHRAAFRELCATIGVDAAPYERVVDAAGGSR